MISGPQHSSPTWAPDVREVEASTTPALDAAVAATAARDRALRTAREHMQATSAAALTLGWEPHIPWNMRFDERAPWAYIQRGTLVSLLQRGGRWWVEIAAASPELVVSGTVAWFLHAPDGKRSFETMDAAVAAALEFMEQNRKA